MTAALKPRCCGRVNSGSAWGSNQCEKTGKFERDGKHYCGTHDPVARKAKHEATMAKWRKDWADRQKRLDEQKQAQDEQARRAGCFDGLLKALERVVNFYDTELPSDVIAQAREAIAKATGAQQ